MSKQKVKKRKVRKFKQTSSALKIMERRYPRAAARATSTLKKKKVY